MTDQRLTDDELHQKVLREPWADSPTTITVRLYNRYGKRGMAPVHIYLDSAPPPIFRRSSIPYRRYHDGEGWYGVPEWSAPIWRDGIEGRVWTKLHNATIKLCMLVGYRAGSRVARLMDWLTEHPHPDGEVKV